MVIYGKQNESRIKDTSVLNDDVPGGFVKHHLVKDVYDLKYYFVVFLLS